ncbi:MAG: dATP pyrophosphohydrolase [Rhizobiales bacterium]|nr:dATP pyrophosphohydrolase [Hyphomicrobiales bacterium]
MAASVEIRPVSDSKGVHDFLNVPFAIYADDPNWIAPLFLERNEHLHPKKNPYFLHADAQLFVVYDAGRPVGRISAQIDKLHLGRFNDATGQFGFLEARDNPQDFAALLKAAETWLTDRGMKRVQGPFSFSINDEMGLLISGFDRPPVIMMGHARPYYQARIEALAYRKAKDVIAYDYDGLQPLRRSLQSMVDKVKASGELTVRPLSKRHLDRDLAIIIDIFNDAWSENWGFVPMTNEEIAALGKNLKFLVAEGYIAIADYQGEPAAMAVTLPDINDWVRGLNGNLLPFGWAKLAYRLFSAPPKAVRMPLMGVLRKHHGTPQGAALAMAVIDAVRSYHLARGTKRAELSWILEDNAPMRRLIEQLGATPYKTYRIYEKDLA